jgi:hypothetical protein
MAGHRVQIRYGPVALALVLLSAVPGSLPAQRGTASPVLEVQQIIVEGTDQLSPPALQFDAEGRLYVAWFQKSGDLQSLRLVSISKEQVVSKPIQVNPAASPPAALHQAPGLATGPLGEVVVTWSTPQKSPGAMFASDLVLSRSADGSRFEPPILVNDDRLPISHSFEHVTVGRDGTVYVAWLDNRDKEPSGAGAILSVSRDGKTAGKNLKIDGMACPCCRPMLAIMPDGGIWNAWRKTFDGNVRDVVVAGSLDGGASFGPPVLVKRDGWVFPACPHRGPSLGFDAAGRLYVGWYTEGTDEQPRLLVAYSDDRGRNFSPPRSLHTATTSLPDQLRMAVHPAGVLVAAWEEVTGVRKRIVMRVSTDRGQSFRPVQTLSEGAKAETPAVAVHDSGAMAVSWTEHAFPHNRIVLQRGSLDLDRGSNRPRKP